MGKLRPSMCSNSAHHPDEVDRDLAIHVTHTLTSLHCNVCISILTQHSLVEQVQLEVAFLVLEEVLAPVDCCWAESCLVDTEGDARSLCILVYASTAK